MFVIDVFPFTIIRPSIRAFIDVDPDRKGGRGEGIVAIERSLTNIARRQRADVSANPPTLMHPVALYCTSDRNRNEIARQTIAFTRNCSHSEDRTNSSLFNISMQKYLAIVNFKVIR